MCGIFGIINKKRRPFKKGLFNVLGIHNDTRGGDSCGIFIDGKVEYGIKEKKLYENFYKDSTLLRDTNKCQIALGHCRKASVGGISLQTAQPVILEEDGQVKFVLIHNGTIINYMTLAKKYIPDIDIKGMTDSQVMARIFYYTGYEVLGEYIGAGAFVCVDYRNETPITYIFKGKSKLREFSTTPTEERPLYCMKTNEEFIFSSLCTYLQAVEVENKVLYIPCNVLISVKNGEVTEVKKYNRDNLHQIQYENSYRSVYSLYDDDDYYSSYNSNTDEGIIVSKEVTTDGITRILTYNKGHICHGVYNVNYVGRILSPTETYGTKLWFFEGNLLYNEECYTVIYNLCTKIGCTSLELSKLFPWLINYFSVYPIKKKGIWRKSINLVNSDIFNGDIVTPFSFNSIIETIKNGKSTRITRIGSYNCCESLKDVMKNFKLDNSELINLIEEFYES